MEYSYALRDENGDVLCGRSVGSINAAIEWVRRFPGCEVSYYHGHGILTQRIERAEWDAIKSGACDGKRVEQNVYVVIKVERDDDK